VDADEFITNAIDLGQKKGMTSLSPMQRIVWMVSEAEVYCDKDGIDALIDHYGLSAMLEFAQAFHAVGASEIAQAIAQIPIRSGEHREVSFDLANRLIRSRHGYSYESIRAAVASGT
jgi:hypothetical protein